MRHDRAARWGSMETRNLESNPPPWPIAAGQAGYGAGRLLPANGGRQPICERILGFQQILVIPQNLAMHGQQPRSRHVPQDIRPDREVLRYPARFRALAAHATQTLNAIR